jgi:hypothetical protein
MAMVVQRLAEPRQNDMARRGQHREHVARVVLDHYGLGETARGHVRGYCGR